MQYFWIEEILYITCIAVIKASVLLLYLRAFPVEWMTTASRILLGFTACWGVAYMIAQIFQCSPVSYMWKQWDDEHEGTCTSRAALAWSHAIINIILDVVIIGMPLPILMKLQVSVGRKLGLGLMFCVGIVSVPNLKMISRILMNQCRVTVISILRLRTLITFGNTQNPSSASRLPDFITVADQTTGDFVEVGVWSLLEINLGIICASMPGVHTLYKHVAPTVSAALSTNKRSSTSKTRSRSGAYNSDPEADRKSGHFIMLRETSPMNNG